MMENKILVTYATKYGSTREVAEAITAKLREKGLNVELEAMTKVRTLEGYRAVVLGAPLYIGSLHKDAQRFFSRHQAALAGCPAALFALGPTEQNQEDWQGPQQQLDQQLAKMAWFKPVASQLFGGRYEPSSLRFPDTLIASLPASPLHEMPPSDMRDWDAIHAWAEVLPERLGVRN
jgi:menaquinone-dependent protoporphyrinogen oxidase